MSDLALSLIRAGVQTVWGFLAALAIAHGIGLSRTAPEWAVQAVTAGVMLAAVAVLRLVERRWPGVGRWLMWGIQALPRYIRPGKTTGVVTSAPAFLSDASRTCTVPAPTPASIDRVRQLLGEQPGGGTTTASGAATVKLDPPQPPTGGTPGDGKDAA